MEKPATQCVTVNGGHGSLGCRVLLHWESLPRCFCRRKERGSVEKKRRLSMPNGARALSAAQARRALSRLCPHGLSNRTQCSFSNFANGERIAFARESAKRVGPMLEQHHLPRREKRQMPSCRWRRSKYFVFRYSTLYTVRKPHQRHVLIAHCTSREHTTWHSLPSERSTNDAQEERLQTIFSATSLVPPTTGNGRTSRYF